MDPFYIANRENLTEWFLPSIDIAPAYFLENRVLPQVFCTIHFHDEAQYNVQLDPDRTLCISIGSKVRFSQEQITMLDIIKPWVTALMHQRMGYEVDVEKTPAEPPLWPETVNQLGTQITARESDVLRLLLSGFSNKEIAGKLSLSAETIKVHRRNIYAKLNIKSQSELFARFFMPKQNIPATH